MARRISMTVLLMLGCAVALTAGCQNVSFAGHDTRPYPVVEDRPTSLAFNAPGLEAAEYASGPDMQLAEIPWYLYRNDLPLSTDAGFSTPAYEQSFTYTYDQQVQTNGRVHNYFNSTTYRTRYQQTVKP